MTWLVFNAETGAQIGALHPTPPEPQAGQSVAVVPASAMASPPLTQWSPVLRGFVDVPQTHIMTRLEFQLLFTQNERAAIRSSADSSVQDFVELSKIAGHIDLTHATTISGVNHLQTVGLLSTARAAQVLAGQAPS
jgi:hypothetical protein